VLRDLDDPSRAVEPDPRSPGGKGFTGLQALLGYVFNQALAINTYGPDGHILAVDAFFSPQCSPYATPATIALAIKQYGPSYRQCYSVLGPNQPGVNETDPSNPSAPVPDPGGAPPGQRGPSTNATRLTAAMVKGAQASAARSAKKETKPATSTSSTSTSTTGTTPAPSTTTGSSTGSGTSTTPVPGAPPINLQKTVGQILAGTVGTAGTGGSTGAAPSTSSSGSSGNQAQQLLNYLLAP
jgi:hypothetical protein